MDQRVVRFVGESKSGVAETRSNGEDEMEEERLF